MIRSPSLAPLVELLAGRRVVVLSGAGCSTESGIPDYRGPDGTARARTPIQYQEFLRSEPARRRYWARSTLGWLRFRAAGPNAAHHALARLEQGGAVVGTITQNVDGLHQAAGSREVVELHGSLTSVRCLACGTTEPRSDFQHRLESLNPEWRERWSAADAVRIAPDGDVELQAPTDGFRVPGCLACGGIAKPDVVFFGENVPTTTLEAAWRVYERGEILLVVGSSLTVYSGRRFIYRAHRAEMPIAVVNLGRTRADEVATAKVDGRLGEILPGLTEALLSS